MKLLIKDIFRFIFCHQIYCCLSPI